MHGKVGSGTSTQTMMPAYIESGTGAALILLGPMLALALVFGVILGLFAIDLSSRARDLTDRAMIILKSYATGVLYCATFSVLGIVSGELAGNSRSPAMGDFLPAVLTLFGILAAVLLTKKSPYRLLALGCALSLSFACFVGTIWGAHMRYYNMNGRASLAQRANVVAECKVQEVRAGQLVEARLKVSGASASAVDMKCADYPHE